jgi:hypothetical protein
MPELFQAFAREYVDLINRQAQVEAARDDGARQELSAVDSKIEAVLAAIEDGIRTPIAKHWVRSARTECLDLVLTFKERHTSTISSAGGDTGRLSNARLVRCRSPAKAILVATSS